ncbi:hypothetical protein Zm00014a_041913 [Zea mays]|uniref:Uncharacterized protein n=2 Tax=Zea mays TaxID=4577 RepID=A0A1D6H4F2_MAIZE|nr:hypothetical protein ZEAMMB73_Zm00001d015862 [Zea mays]PWZ21741.1 hypothetical protein Zm00014a_041913 [Zea mays]
MNRQASRRGHRVRHVRLGSLLRLRVRLFGLLVRCLEDFNWYPRGRSRPHNKMMLSHADTGPAERENSLQADAIADCLEFIKRSYLPAGDQQPDCC